MDSQRPAPRLPRTLLDAVRYFADADTCRDFMVELRWPNGVACPTCGRTDVRFIATRKLWECKDKHPRKQFSIKVGTIFEDSPLGMDKWLPVVWLIANCKNGVSSYEVARDLGVTQKTAWFMLQRVRVAMETGTFQKIAGEVEVDETFIGGLARNMHKKVREAKIHGTGPTDKTAVMGVLERKGEVRAFVVKNRKKATLQAKIREHVAPGSEVFTDALRSMRGSPPNTPTKRLTTPRATSGARSTPTAWKTSGACSSGRFVAPMLPSPPSTFTATSMSRSSATTPAPERTERASSQLRLTRSAAASPTKN